MKILVRLPNWLGDLVMSIGFINALQQLYPEASISVIVKKGINELLEFLPPTEHQFVFVKEDYPGLKGAWRFGRMIRKTARFDLFFCLPDSFSSAFMGFASGSKKRIGYEKELRQILLTSSYKKNVQQQHRVDEYVDLLRKFTKKQIEVGPIVLKTGGVQTNDTIIVNINSEASSRRLPVHKAVDLIGELRNSTSTRLILVGGKKDRDFVESVFNLLPDTSNIICTAGKTSLPEFVNLMAASKVVLTTDSGPAHVANALGIHTIVLTGAGDERNTAPYNKENRTIIRLGQLPCEPCVKNKCLIYGVPKCLELLDNQLIISAVLEHWVS